VFLFVVLGAAVLLAVIIGGDIRRLSQIRLRMPYLLIGAFVGRVLVAVLGGLHSEWAVNLARPLNILVALAMIAFVWFNRHLPGAILFGVGQTLNLVALIAFGGRMPVLLPAGADRSSPRLSLLTSGLDPLHVLLTEPRGLWFFGDILTIPVLRWTSVVSIGDLCMAAAVGWLVIQISRRRPARSAVAYGPGSTR